MATAFECSLAACATSPPRCPSWSSWAVHRCTVLDGESLVLTDEGRPRPFQETMSNTSAGVLVPRFFDCLHLDGFDLLDAPLAERLDALARVAAPYRMPGVVAPDRQRAAALLDEALAAGHEGVMVQSLDATYA